MEGELVVKERNLQSIRKRVFDIIQIGKYKDYVSRAFDVFIALVIIANITALFLVLGTGACPVPGSVQCYRSDHGFHLYRGICASDLDGRLLLSE